jgi:hypothetical protein
MIQHDKCQAFEKVIAIRDHQIELLQIKLKELEDKIRTLEQSSMNALRFRKEDGERAERSTTL